ncbi:integrator complex subunit 3-like [Ornithodoros turicata]|uniref:SOSS complex subunit A homolog n=1 Tax=Ornithodoros turicata TaxID=34597 RepID=A0A2R5LCI0_9ACAR
MDSNKGTSSRLFALSPIEAKEEIDEKFERCFTFLQGIISGVSEKEAHDALNAAVCKAAQAHDDINTGFLYGILTDSSNGARYYRDVTFIARDGLQHLINQLSLLILEKYPKLHDSCRSQLIWLIKELIKNSVINVDTLCQNLLRQIAGGDVSPKNVFLVEAMLDIFNEHSAWLAGLPVLTATAVYTYLRLIVDHGSQPFLTLRQREVDFCIGMLREKFTECAIIGRDLVRLLQNVARLPEFEKLWKDILHNPSSLSPTFTGAQQLLTQRTSRRFLQCRLTPDMERKIIFLTSQVKFGNQKRYQDWFQKQYLSTPESQSLRCDIIRFICGVIHPSNELLCSDIIPRWAVIGWLLTTCTSNVAASNAKLALFYDWLFFNPERDNIMNIEPAILVMYHSMRPHPAITATLLDFLCRIMPNFCKNLAAQVKQGIYTSLRQILEKRVLASLSPLFDNPKLDKELRSMIREQFAEFCSPVDGKVEDPVPLPPGAMILDGNHNSVMNCEGEAQFSEDEDDIPLGKLRSKDIKFQPIRESKVEQIDISEHLAQLNGNIKKNILELQNEKDSESQCEIVERLLQAILREEDFDQDTATSIGTCLAQILDNEFTRRLLPQEPDDESIEESIGTPLFVLFRNLCQTPEEDPSRQAQLTILWEVGALQPRLGYRLLYFLRTSSPPGGGGSSPSAGYSSYRDYARSHSALSACLLQDLRLCQEDDVRLFCYLIPEIYTQFPNVAIGNTDILNMVVSCIDASQLQDLVCQILQGNMVMFRKDSFISILNASLEWETFEQFCLWQLIAAHNIPVDYILPILPKLEFQAHAEALTSILLLLKQEMPSAELLKHILCRDAKSNDFFVVSILKYWTQEHEEKLSELVGSLFSKTGAAAKRKRPQMGNKSQGPAVEQTLAHLDQLRQHCKQTSFFSQPAIQAALSQVQATAAESQKTKYSDLFALSEDTDDMKTPSSGTTGTKSSSGRSSGGSGRGGGKSGGGKGAARSKMALADTDSSTESSDDEETAKPKPPRKKKKTQMVTSDSD